MQRIIPDTLDALQGSIVVTLSNAERLTFNVTLNKPFSDSDPLQSILISKPASINSSAVTLASLVGGNASDTQQVSQADACFFTAEGGLLSEQHALMYAQAMPAHALPHCIKLTACAPTAIVVTVLCNIDLVSR